ITSECVSPIESPNAFIALFTEEWILLTTSLVCAVG
ncbi:hypothetical protein LCGC14_1437320, partial [marine sediment metagenome]